MLRIVRLVAGDLAGFTRVFGPLVAARWLWAMIVRLGECRRLGNLKPADRALGGGPFRARLRGARAILVGEETMTNAREIWIRDVYLDGGVLEIPPAASVVDLGSRRGMFTLLALGHGPGVSVVSVEADPSFRPILERNLEANGWTGRVQVINAFVGGVGVFQRDLLEKGGAGDVPRLTEDQLIDQAGLEHVDFLKCDIEGSEYDLLTPKSRLLAMTDRLAIELHRPDGDADAFMDMLAGLGFSLHVSHESAGDLVVLARRIQRDSPHARRVEPPL